MGNLRACGVSILRPGWSRPAAARPGHSPLRDVVAQFDACGTCPGGAVEQDVFLVFFPPFAQLTFEVAIPRCVFFELSMVQFLSKTNLTHWHHLSLPYAGRMSSLASDVVTPTHGSRVSLSDRPSAVPYTSRSWRYARMRHCVAAQDHRTRWCR